MKGTKVEEIHMGKTTRYPVEKEFALTKAAWAKLSPTVKEMIRKNRIHWIELPEYNPA